MSFTHPRCKAYCQTARAVLLGAVCCSLAFYIIFTICMAAKAS